jgi:2-dehydropantoate 2-reductase
MWQPEKQEKVGTRMRILIFGAGALGSVVGGILSKRHEVHLVVRPENAKAIKELGLRIEGEVKGRFSVEAHTDLEDVPQPEIILITVKAYDTQSALEALEEMANKARIVVSLQNGLTNLNHFRAALPEKTVMGATSMGATFTGPGKVVYAGKGATIFGPLSKNAGLSKEMAQLFNQAGLNARAGADIESELWMKGIINASINPLTAILGCLNGELLEDEGVLGISHLASDEAVAVAEGIGVHLPPGDPFEKVRDVMRATAKNRSSMLQDLERGKRTEIDEINGEVVRRAGSIGVPVPVNRTLWMLVRALERRGP